MHFKRIHANQEKTIISARNMKFTVWICLVFTKEIHMQSRHLVFMYVLATEAEHSRNG